MPSNEQSVCWLNTDLPLSPDLDSGVLDVLGVLDLDLFGVLQLDLIGVLDLDLHGVLGSLGVDLVGDLGLDLIGVCDGAGGGVCDLRCFATGAGAFIGMALNEGG